jgi:hypothetical protein
MKKLILLLLFFLADVTYSQVLTGRVLDENREPLPNATIRLLSLADSSFVNGTASDVKGKFLIRTKMKDNLLKVTVVGYKQKYINCQWNTDIGDISMVQDSKSLEGVTVTESYIVMKKENMAIHVPESIKKNTFDGYATLSALPIPGLSVDPVAYKVTSKTGDVLLCINGREVDIDEIRTLNPQNIKRIDYYPNFDSKHPSAAAVIDFIIINPNRGGILYGNAEHNLNIGRGNAILDLKHYKKNSELDFQISGDYSQYTQKRGEESVTNMVFNDVEVAKTSEIKDSPQRSNRLSSKISWLRQGENDMLQLAAYLGNSHAVNNQNMLQTYSSVTKTEIMTEDRSHKDNISPAAQIYYQRKIFVNGLFRTTVYGSYSHTDKYRDYISTSSIVANTKEDLYRIRPNVLIGLTLGKNRPFVYATYDYKRTNNKYAENEVESKNKLSYGNGAFQIGNSFVISKNFRLSVHLTENVLSIDDGKESRTKWFLSPSLLYNANLGNGNIIRGELYSYVNDPQINYYNGSSQKMDQYQVLRGNPNLMNGQCVGVESVFDSNHKWGMFELLTQYINMPQYIYEDVFADNENGVFIHTYKNGGKYNHFLLNGELRLNVIPKKLVWMIAGEYDLFKEGGKKINEFVAGADLTYTGKNFIGKMEYVSPIRYLAKGVEYKKPNSVKLSLKYTINKLQVGMYAVNPFMRSYVRTKYATDKYSNMARTYSPRVSSNMFMFTLSYRVSYGKKHKFQSVEMDNTQSSGLLEQQDIRNEEMEKGQK